MYNLAFYSRVRNWTFLLASILTGSLLPAFGAVTPNQLVCEYQTNPLGITVLQPRLGWQFAADPGTPRGWLQSAYEIQAASSGTNLANNVADLWDSGQVQSAQNTFVSYTGTALKTSQQVFWRVRVWDQNGTVSPWSATASWTMGLLVNTDWQATWIMMPTVNGASYPYTANSPTDTASVPQSVMARKDFTVNAGLTRATLTICGLGCYEASINGVKVGQSLFPPGWTNYSKTCLYDTYDVTSMVTSGSSNNAIGVVLANGMYNEQGGRYTRFTTNAFGEKKVIGQLRLEYSNGTVAFVPTDTTWKITSGPLTFSSVYGGEDEDIRLEPAGWNKAGFNTSSWQTPLATVGPGGTLKGTSFASPPVQAFDTYAPVKSTTVSPGVVVYDLGQNASFMPKITVHGLAGSYVVITPAELVNSDGTLQDSDGTPTYWRYTLSGAPSQTWMPRFTYRGCRYLQVQGFAAPGTQTLPVLDSIQGILVHSASPSVGTFSCSNALFNSIHSLMRFGEMNNMETYFTDCPQREKLGWLEEDHLVGPALRYDFGLGQLFTKQLNDIKENQQSNGFVATTAPEYAFDLGGEFGDFDDSPEWGSTLIQAAWQQYQFNGDTGILANNYTAMKKMVAYLGTRANGNTLNYGLGDWVDFGTFAGAGQSTGALTPQGLTATAYYYYDAAVLAQIAQVLGNTADVTAYQHLATTIAASFNAQFYNSTNGCYSNLSPTNTNPLLGSQTANAMPLDMNIVAPGNTSSVLKALVQDITNHGTTFTTGEIGFPYMQRALAENGRSDLIFAMNDQSTTPGYGYILAQGATSMTETWNANPTASQDHFLLCALNEWLYHDLGGIQSDPAGPGFKKIIIKPAMVGDITSTNVSYQSINGQIVSNWTNAASGLTMNVTIPPSTTATIYVPTANPALVQESGGPASSAVGVQYLGASNGMAIYAVGSGTYSFSSVAAPAAPTKLSAVANNGQVTLSWISSANAASYNILRSTISGSGYTTIASNVTAGTYTDNGLTNGVTYYYVVSAVNANGATPSSEVNATPALILFQDAGFESPDLFGGYLYNITGSPWTFAGESGIAGNGNAFTTSNPNTLEGVQVAFLQGTGVISQVLNNLVPGATYTLTFSAAQRAIVNGNGQTWQVMLDGTVVGTYAPPQTATSYTDYTASFTASAASQTLSFVGTDANGGDNTIFIDNLRLSQPTLALVQDDGFELPSVSGGFVYGVTGSPWTFSAQSGNSGAGITGNGSGFTNANANAPEGVQVAFLQGNGTFSQVLNNLIPGANYSLTFSAAQRAEVNVKGQTWQVKLDNKVIGTYAPGQSATAYTNYTTNFAPTATSQTLSFVGTNTNGGDNTIFIDNIRVPQLSPALLGNGPPPAIALVNAPYTFSYQVTGTPAPTFSLASGSLPPGLTLTASGVLSGIPTSIGTYTGIIATSNGISPTVTQHFSIQIVTQFSLWESPYFNAQQLANPAISGATAMPQNDGMANLLKYLFDINPAVPMTASDRAALPQGGMSTIGGTSYLTLTYRQNALAPDLTVQVQTSSDLQTWQTVTPDFTTTLGSDPATGDPIIQVAVKASGATQEFIRLNVTGL